MLRTGLLQRPGLLFERALRYRLHRPILLRGHVQLWRGRLHYQLLGSKLL